MKFSLVMDDTEIEVLYCSINNEMKRMVDNNECGESYHVLENIHKKVFKLLPADSDYKTDPDLVYIYGPTTY